MCIFHHIIIFLSVIVDVITADSGTVAPCTIQGQSNNKIEEPLACGTEVVLAVVSKVQSTNIFPLDHNFLRRIAWVESKDGTDSDTYRDNFYGGIWQVHATAFKETQRYSSHESLMRKYDKIEKCLGIHWEDTTWEDLNKPLYSGLAARLYLSIFNEGIPENISEQAEYWKMNYNTVRGSGTTERFTDDVVLLNSSTPVYCSSQGNPTESNSVINGAQSVNTVIHYVLVLSFIIRLVI